MDGGGGEATGCCGRAAARGRVVSATAVEPFVVIATTSARAEAEARGLGCIENLVEHAIECAGLTIKREGRSRKVALGEGVVAHTLTTPDRTAGGRRKLLVTCIKDKRSRRTQ